VFFLTHLYPYEVVIVWNINVLGDKMAKLIQVTDETYSTLLRAKAKLMSRQNRHVTFDDVLKFFVEKRSGDKSDKATTSEMG
jgi:uncharacterized transporter YbjL